MKLSRRRFLLAAIAAGAVGRISPQRWEWRGSALGAEARIVLTGPRDQAEAALAAVTAEIDRLEEIFSLHRPGSQLSRLNARHALETPSRDLREVLAASLRWKRLTGGAFDPAVQPLWRRLAQGAGAPMQTTLERVHDTEITIAPHRLTLSPGAALTLNGIAQGTIADRIAGMLVQYGFDIPLIDTGEMRLPGSSRRTVDLPEAGLRLHLAEAAVATSAPAAFTFGAADRHHLFDPQSGASPGWWRSVTVVAATAEMADALSTAFAVSSPDKAGDLAASIDDIAVFATERTGEVRSYGAPWLLREITQV